MRRVRMGITVLLGVVVVITGCAGARNESATSPESAAPDLGFADYESVAYEEAAWRTTSEVEVAAAQESGMIVYTGELALVVEDPTQTQSEVERIAADAGGYVASANSYVSSDGLRRVTVTLRVPAASFFDAMETLRGLAIEIERDSISSEDVTQEYVDLESRLAALEVKAERLEELMDEAEDTEAVLAIYRELSATQIQIEETKGRMRYLERRSTMSTITVSLVPDEALRPVEIGGWRLGGTLRRAVEALVSAFQFLVRALIWLVIVVVPVLAIIGLIVYGIVRLLRASFGWGKGKRQGESETEAERRE